MTLRPLAIALPLLLGPLAAPGVRLAAATADATLTVSLRVRVARCPRAAPAGDSTGQPIRSRAWVRAHLRAAEQLLAPHRVRIVARIEDFSPAECILLGRKARDALAPYVITTGKEVTVLIVGRVRDLDLPSYDLMGVHWRYGGSDAALRGRRWIYLTARARPPVLAHELAHYFGVPHDPRGGNLMTPGPSSPLWRRAGSRPAPFAPLLTRAQAARMRAGITRHLRREPSVEGGQTR